MASSKLLARTGCVALVALAACFHGPTVKPSATLAPGVDALSPRSRGPFAVVHAAPRGHVADRKQPGVTVLFSRGVRAVETPDDQGVPAISMRHKSGAAVPGTWRWTGTRGLLFRPEGELPGGSDFVVEVPGDVRALDGSTLGAPYRFELSTDGPNVAHFKVLGPAGIAERSMPESPRFHVQFDQDVDPAAVAAATTLRVFKGDGDRGEVVKVKGVRAPVPAPATAPAGALVKKPRKGAPPPAAPPPAGPPAPEAWSVVLEPETKLPLDHQVEVSVAASLRGLGGPRPMGETFVRTLRTHGPLRFVDFYCPRIEAKGRCRANGDVKIALSNPVTPDELRAHLKLGALPAKPASQRGPRSLDPSLEHWLAVAPKLGEKYRLTLTAGMKDIYGQQLAKDASFEIEIEAPLTAPPVKAVAAVDEPPAPRPKKPRPKDEPLDRPRRERLPYELDLGLAGSVLEATGGHKLPVGAVNVPTYSAVTAGLSDAQATSWLLARGSVDDFVSRNGLASTWVLPRAPTNHRAVDFLDLDATLAPRKGRGPALVVLTPPGAAGDAYGRTAQLVNVTDLGVTAKMSAFGNLVWVTQLSSGKPVAGANVSIRVAKGGEVFAGATDASGLVVIPVERFDPIASGKLRASDDDDYDDSSGPHVRDDAAIVVRSGDDWTIAKVAHSSVERRLTSEFQQLGKEGEWVGTIFADRGVFRPGETAKVSGIVRVAEASGLRSIRGRELRVELTGANGDRVFDGRATCDDFGMFAMDMPIPKSAPLGQATITATALAGGKTNTLESGVFRHPVKILAFKPNEFKVTAESDKPWYVRGDTATFTTQGDYLYGAPMQGASVTSTVARQEVPVEIPNSEGFTLGDDLFTGDFADETRASDEVDNQDGTLDASGRFARSVELSFADQRRTERVVFDAEVQDLSRATVSARASAVVHPGEFYAAVRTPKDRFVAAGSPLKTEVAAIEPSGTRRPNVKVKVELVERRWSAVTGEQPDGSPKRSSKPQDVVVGSCDATTGTAAAGCDVRVPRAGYFIVRATATDPRGNTVRASTSVYGTESSPTAAPAWAADDRHAIKLETNKKSYAVGETARVVLRSPFREGQALVTVERNGVLWRHVLPIKGAVPVVDVPIKPEMYPNAFVSVVALRGRVAPAPATGADLGAPDYRYGWTELRVDENAHRLKVAITQPKAEYQPGTVVESDVVVKDQAGNPVETELTFYVVDEGVLALTSYVTPDPLPAFVHRRKLGVFTFDNREALGRILPLKAGERLPPRGYEYALARNPGDAYDKGDDGGDGDGGKRADFKTTAYFEAGKRTDKAGRTHFSFKLPDNLTTFRVMAVAAAADDRFGSGESKVTTFRRLMARPALPRLLRVGDALEASVVVSSKPGSGPAGPMNVDVKLTAAGLTAGGPLTRTITMQRGGQAEVRFPVKATAAGDATLVFDVRAGADADRVEVRRKVELPTAIESKAVYGETKGEAAIALGKLDGVRPDFGGLDVRVSSSALVGLGLAIDHLTDYPYGCTEQVTSRLVPLVALGDLPRELGARRFPSNVDGAIEAAVALLVKRQNYDGGFGFWDRSESSPALSAYTMLALQGAAERRRFVPRDVLEHGREYLALTMASGTRTLARERDAAGAGAGGKAPKDASPEEAKRLEEEAIVARATSFVATAFVADTLATLGGPNPGGLNVLYDVRAGQRLSGQAALLHAMAKAEMNPAQLRSLAKEIEGRLRVGAAGVDVDEADDDRFAPLLESRARTLALVLRAFLAVDAKHPLAPRIARQLLALRRDAAWRTTQEDAWALLALADYRRLQESSAGAFDVSTYLGGKELLVSKFPRGALREENIAVATSKLLERGPSLAFAVSGEGTAFYGAELRYATTALPTRPRDEGLFVAKYVRGLPASEVSRALPTIPQRTADAVAAGDLVLVDLLFETAEPREHVVIDDPLPAGLEALDYEIDTTSQASRDAEAKPASGKEPTWLGTTFRQASSRREVHDDRVLTFFEHLEPGMYRVHYLARAASVGSFVVPPTRIEAMYSPEVYGRTAASRLAVTAKR